MTKENFTQERLENYTNQLIQHMEEMTTNWQQGWMGATNQMIAGGFPTNLKGRQYNGMNALFLFLVSAEMGYKSQTWLTVKQANEAGYRIKKGEKDFVCLDKCTSGVLNLIGNTLYYEHYF